jgi:hypothetical protein
MFDVVPATVVATVTSSNNTQTKLNLFVDKWSNENALWNDIKVYLTWLTLATVANTSGLELITIRNSEWIIMTWVNWALTALTTAELVAGDNEITISYTAWSTYSPSYTVDMTDFEFTTSLAPATKFSGRLEKALTLVTR